MFFVRVASIMKKLCNQALAFYSTTHDEQFYFSKCIYARQKDEAGQVVGKLLHVCVAFFDVVVLAS